MALVASPYALTSHKALFQSWAKKMRLRGGVHNGTEINDAFTGLNIFSILLGVASQIVVDDIIDCRMPDSGFLLLSATSSFDPLAPGLC